MLDVEVVLVVEDGDGLAVVLGVGAAVIAVGGDGDGRKIDLLVQVGRFSRNGSHDDGRWRSDSNVKGKSGVCSTSFVGRGADDSAELGGKKGDLFQERINKISVLEVDRLLSVIMGDSWRCDFAPGKEGGLLLTRKVTWRRDEILGGANARLSAKRTVALISGRKKNVGGGSSGRCARLHQTSAERLRVQAVSRVARVAIAASQLFHVHSYN